jgi:hypothetical protein
MERGHLNWNSSRDGTRLTLVKTRSFVMLLIKPTPVYTERVEDHRRRADAVLGRHDRYAASAVNASQTHSGPSQLQSGAPRGRSRSNCGRSE